MAGSSHACTLPYNEGRKGRSSVAASVVLFSLLVAPFHTFVCNKALITKSILYSDRATASGQITQITINIYMMIDEALLYTQNQPNDLRSQV